MHFHLPKPLHGWREFFGEVAIIVLGLPVLGQPALLQLLVLIPRCLQGCIASLVGAGRMPERIAGAAR